MNPTHKKIAEAIKKVADRIQTLNDKEHDRIIIQFKEEITKEIADIFEEEEQIERMELAKKVGHIVTTPFKFNKSQFLKTAGVEG